MKKSTKGRKPAADPKQELRIYVESSIINANGGIDNAKVITYDYLKMNTEKQVGPTSKSRPEQS